MYQNSSIQYRDTATTTTTATVATINAPDHENARRVGLREDVEAHTQCGLHDVLIRSSQNARLDAEG